MILFFKERQEADSQGQNGQRVTNHEDTHAPLDRRGGVTAYRKFEGRAGRIGQRDKQPADVTFQRWTMIPTIAEAAPTTAAAGFLLKRGVRNRTAGTRMPRITSPTQKLNE